MYWIFANVEKQMKPLLAKAEEYGMTNIYYQTMTNKALYHLREHRYLDAIAFIDKEIEHARKHFFFVLRSLIRTSDALRRRYLRSVIKEKSSFFSLYYARLFVPLTLCVEGTCAR